MQLTHATCTFLALMVCFSSIKQQKLRRFELFATPMNGSGPMNSGSVSLFALYTTVSRNPDQTNFVWYRSTQECLFRAQGSEDYLTIRKDQYLVSREKINQLSRCQFCLEDHGQTRLL